MTAPVLTIPDTSENTLAATPQVFEATVVGQVMALLTAPIIAYQLFVFRDALLNPVFVFGLSSLSPWFIEFVSVWQRIKITGGHIEIGRFRPQGIQLSDLTVWRVGVNGLLELCTQHGTWRVQMRAFRSRGSLLRALLQGSPVPPLLALKEPSWLRRARYVPLLAALASIAHSFIVNTPVFVQKDVLIAVGGSGALGGLIGATIYLTRRQRVPSRYIGSIAPWYSLVTGPMVLLFWGSFASSPKASWSPSTLLGLALGVVITIPALILTPKPRVVYTLNLDD